MSRRQSKAEGSFADAANNHGFKRARWRGLVMVEIQNLTIAAIQNLRKLIKSTSPRKPSSIGALASLEGKIIVFGWYLAIAVVNIQLFVANIRHKRVLNL